MSSSASLNHVYRTVWNESLGAMVAVAEIETRGSGGSSRARGAAGGRRPLARIGHLAICIALGWGHAGGAWADATAPVSVLPKGGAAIHGQATFTNPQPNSLLVTTQNGAGTRYSAINWQSFSIGAGSSAYFAQPDAASLSINRVVTNTPSQLFGTLSSNGQIVLVNQSGIAVGAGAVVDTAGFTASALRMSDADALAARMVFGDGSAAGAPVSASRRCSRRPTAPRCWWRGNRSK